MADAFRPMLLLSMPQLQDPNFTHTVVLLSDFTAEGAFGLILNRPAHMDASEVIRMTPQVASPNSFPLFIGGPVLPEVGWILVDSAPDDTEYRTVLDGLYLSASPDVLRHVLEVRPAPRARVLAGYSGWGPGQLDAELAESAWLMCDIDADLIWNVDPSEMWEAAIRRMGADPSSLHLGHGIQ